MLLLMCPILHYSCVIMLFSYFMIEFCLNLHLSHFMFLFFVFSWLDLKLSMPLSWLVSQKQFLMHIILFKKIYGPKNLEIAFGLTIGLFFVGYLAIGLFMLLFIFSSNVFAINLWFKSMCFFNVIRPLFLKYETRTFLNLVICYNITWPISLLWHKIQHMTCNTLTSTFDSSLT